jgi:hypothetical protein
VTEWNGGAFDGDSGGGFEIIQEVLNDVTGTPFPKLMHDFVLLGGLPIRFPPRAGGRAIEVTFSRA